MTYRVLIATWVLLAAAVTTAHASAISGCSSGDKCTTTLQGITTNYFCDNCPSGNCSIGTGSANTCPGHCTLQPAFECVSDTQCGGSNPDKGVCSASGVFYFCKIGTPQAGQPCAADANCSADRQSTCPVFGGACCDFAGATQSFAGDGKYVVCGTNGADTINGSSGDDIVCGKGGNDTINGNDGNDILMGDAGNDTINGGAGNDIIFGGDDDDTLTGGALATSGPDISGDDIIFGGNGNDVILGNGGRDYLDGGPGNDDVADTLVTGYGGLIPPDDSLGSLLCGGAGDDRLWATGPRHQCIDAGPDQTGSRTYFGADCTYEYAVLGGRSCDATADVGTARNCKLFNNFFGCSSEFPSSSACGCD